MKKQITLIALLLATLTGKLFAGGPTAPYRFDSTFAQNGFLIDTTTGGANSYLSYREIMVSNTGSTLHQFWVGGVCNTTFLANKFSANGSLLFSRVGADQTVGSGQTGAMLFNKVYLGGIANSGGHFQNIALNFDGSNHSIFNQPAGADSFLTPAIYAQGAPIGSGASNCSAVLANGHIVTVVKDVSDSTYITEFDPAASGGTSVITYPMFNSGGNFMFPKALRAIPGTNNYAVLIYDANTSTSQLYFLTNGVATASYTFNSRYEAMIAVSSTQVLLGGNDLRFVNVSNGTSVIASANMPLVEQLTRDEQTGEIYAYSSERIFAITPAGDLDNDYNPDGQGNNFAYTFVQANYFLSATNLIITDMEMQGSDILLTGYSLQINGGSVATGYASFVVKVRGKNSNPNPCNNFSVQLDSIYGTSGCDWSANITLTGAFPMNAFVHWASGGSSSNTVTASPYIPSGLCPENYDITFTDGNGCKDTIYFVTPPPCAAPVINDPLTISGSLCPGTAVTIGPVTSSAGNLIYQWYKNGQSISGATGSAYAINSLDATSDNGNYTVVITNVCGSDTSLAYSLTAHSVPVPGFTASGNVLTCTITAANYQWYFNGVVIPTVNSNQYTATQTGEYRVEIITSDGCSALSSAQNITVVGISETQNLKLSVYPNPANEFVFIQCDEQIETVEVYNITGEQVLFVKGQITRLNTALLTPGLYTVQVKTTNGNSTLRKFVKQ